MIVRDKVKTDEGLPNVIQSKLSDASMRATEGSTVVDKKMAEATEGLRAKFENVQITEGLALGIHMVDFKQHHAEMEEVKRCLEMEREQMRGGYPKKNVILRDYMFHCHRRNQEMLLCPRCSIICNQRVAAEFKRAQHA